jgi:Mg2+ and Co2+ transporter CorA
MALFQTDVLVRSFIDLPIVVGVEVKIKNSPNFDASSAQELLTEIVTDYIEPYLIPTELRSDVLEQTIRSTIPNLDSVRIFEFRRRYKSLEQVEVIQPLKNEIPKFDSSVSALTAKA